MNHNVCRRLADLLITGKKAVFLGGVSLLCILFCAACAKQTKAEPWEMYTIVETYDDGSRIYYIGGSEYKHILFDENEVCYRGFTGEFLFLDPKNDFPFSLSNESFCTIESYSFSAEGYIAYHAYLIMMKQSNAISYEWINSSLEPIKAEVYALLDLNARTEKKYENYTSLYADCERNGIVLGVRYVCSPFNSEPEIVSALVEDYSLVEYPFDFCAIRKGQEDLYYGKISDLRVTGEAITFALTVPRIRRFPRASALTNASLDLKDPTSFSFFQILFKRDILFQGEISIPLDE